MAWVEVGGTTQTLTGSGTPDVLDTETAIGDYKFTVDLDAMALGDAVTLTIAIKARAGATSRVVHTEYFNNVQATKIYQGPVITSISELIVTITQTAGTGRSIIWSLEYDAGAPTVAQVVAGIGAIPTAAAIADAVMDEAASDHVANGSFGAKFQTKIGVAQSGSPTTIQLAAGAVSADDQFNNGFVCILAGTGAGQQRGIVDTVNATDTLTVATWTVEPDSTSVYVVFMN